MNQEKNTESFVPLQSHHTQTNINNQTKTSQENKPGKFKASKMIAVASWSLLKKDKEMMLFPIFSMLANIAFIAIIGIIFFLTTSQGNIDVDNIGNIKYLFIFIIYAISYFITIFFEAGIIAIAHGRINGQDLTFSDGLQVAKKYSGKLFVWSLISSTVGVILRAIAERSKLIGKIVASLLGAAWSILSYFIVPVLILENLSVTDSLKRSADTIKRSWGETAIVNIGVGFIFAILILVGFIIGVIISILISSIVSGIIFPVIIFFGFIFYVFVLTLISSTLSTVFKVVLYEYTTKGIVSEGFSKEILQSAFKNK